MLWCENLCSPWMHTAALLILTLVVLWVFKDITCLSGKPKRIILTSISTWRRQEILHIIPLSDWCSWEDLIEFRLLRWPWWWLHESKGLIVPQWCLVSVLAHEVEILLRAIVLKLSALTLAILRVLQLLLKNIDHLLELFFSLRWARGTLRTHRDVASVLEVALSWTELVHEAREVVLGAKLLVRGCKRVRVVSLVKLTASTLIYSIV